MEITAPRTKQPCVFHKDGIWYLTRYHDVKMLLEDSRIGRAPPTNCGLIDHSREPLAFNEIVGKWTLFIDPPEHARYRKALNGLFDPRFIKNMRSSIESLTQSLLAKMLTHSQADLMDEYARRMPIEIIKPLLGLTQDNDTLRDWSISLSAALDNWGVEDFAKATPNIIALQIHFQELIHKRTQEPSNDWISYLIEKKDIYSLTDEDIIANCILLFSASHETLQLTVGLGVMALLQNPEQLTLLQNNKKLIPSAVEEILRYCSPVRKLTRWTKEEVVFGSTTIPKDQLIVGLIKEANFDPLRFDNPQTFDITRNNNRHLSFGYGLHQCVGALLARLQIQIALDTLLPHLSRFTLIEDEIEWLPYSGFHYLYKLPIHIK